MNETKTEWIFFPQLFSDLSLPTSGDSCELSPQNFPCRSTAVPISKVPILSCSIFSRDCWGAWRGKFVFQELSVSLLLEGGQVAAVGLCPPGAGAGSPSWQVPLPPKYPNPGHLPRAQTLLPFPTAHSMWWRQKISTLPSFLK